MNFRQLLANTHPKLKEKYSSEQYALSKEIIKKKLKLEMSQPALAVVLGVSYEKYLEMEMGSVNIPVSDYQLALEKLNDYTKPLVDDELIEEAFEHPTYIIKPMNLDLGGEDVIRKSEIWPHELLSKKRKAGSRPINIDDKWIIKTNVKSGAEVVSKVEKNELSDVLRNIDMSGFKARKSFEPKPEEIDILPYGA